MSGQLHGETPFTAEKGVSPSPFPKPPILREDIFQISRTLYTVDFEVLKINFRGCLTGKSVLPEIHTDKDFSEQKKIFLRSFYETADPMADAAYMNITVQKNERLCPDLPILHH